MLLERNFSSPHVVVVFLLLQTAYSLLFSFYAITNNWPWRWNEKEKNFKSTFLLLFLLHTRQWLALACAFAVINWWASSDCFYTKLTAFNIDSRGCDREEKKANQSRWVKRWTLQCQLTFYLFLFLFTELTVIFILFIGHKKEMMTIDLLSAGPSDTAKCEWVEVSSAGTSQMTRSQ